MSTILTGITWDHPRGYDPMVAVSAAWMEMHPDVEIRWDRRSLRDFGEVSILDLAGRYDLVVLDHPWIGTAVANRTLLPLDEHLGADYLEDLKENSVGPSYPSYHFEGHQWALPVDAAAQVSAYRPDLLEELCPEPPQTWEETFALAERLKGGPCQVAMALTSVDCIPTFVSLCVNQGNGLCPDNDLLVDSTTGEKALAMMQRLVACCHPESLDWSPPKLLDRLATTDEILYCPLLFGYTNYARPGYAPQLVRFTNIPQDPRGLPAGAILGGAGLAISRQTRHPKAAAEFAAYACSEEVQSGLYFQNSGQPAHRKAWLDPLTNAGSSGFFHDTLATLDHACLRPRHNGYASFQENACLQIHAFLKGELTLKETLSWLNTSFKATKKPSKP